LKKIKDYLNKYCPSLYNFLRKWYYKNKILPKEFIDHINKLNRTDVVIDLGANVGAITEILARTKSKVYAFEPNTKAFYILKKNMSKYDNVILYNSAAGIKNSNIKLYLHKDYNNSEDDLTQASSLNFNKENISQYNYEIVKEINFSKFLSSLNRKIEIIKIDIEGYEIKLINHLLDNGILNNIGKIYLETHENKNHLLKDDTLKLKDRIKKEGFEKKFFFGWH
tara:strand:+ start:1982 stop:2653 length:672 start_codon:yes stop_codon:yes gene_type:complete